MNGVESAPATGTLGALGGSLIALLLVVLLILALAWLLRRLPGGALRAHQELRIVAQLAVGVRERVVVVAVGETQLLLGVTAENVRLGVPEKLARKMAALLLTRGGLDISDLARIHNRDVVETARMYSVLSDRLGLVWLHRSVENLAVEGRWQALARSNLRDEFYRIRRDLSSILLRGPGKGKPEKLFEAWSEQNEAGIRKLDAILAEMKLRQEVDFATLSVAAQELRKLIAS